MLPFVLGGIAITAVGYTLKRAMEDDMFRNKLEDKVMGIGDWLYDMDMKLTNPSDDPFPSTVTADMLQEWHDLGRTDTLRQTVYETSLHDYFERCGREDDLAMCEAPRRVPLSKLMLTAQETQLLRTYGHVLVQAAQGLDEALKRLDEDANARQEADAYAALVCKMLRAKVLNKSNDIHPKLAEKIAKFSNKLAKIQKEF